MEIYDLCENDGLASGIYRCRTARGGKILKFTAFGLIHCAAAEILSRGSVVVVVQQWRRCACALRAGLAASGRELRGRLCGACCCGSGDQRRSIGSGSGGEIRQ